MDQTIEQKMLAKMQEYGMSESHAKEALKYAKREKPLEPMQRRWHDRAKGRWMRR